MSVSRRHFLRLGGVAALAVGISTQLTGVVFGQQAAAAGNVNDPPRGPFARPDRFGLAAYSPHVNETFAARHGAGGPVTLKLIRAEGRGPKDARADAECFSLVFRGSHTSPLPQDVYALRHPAIGEVSLLLVPVVSKDGRARYYEAVINRRLPAG